MPELIDDKQIGHWWRDCFDSRLNPWRDRMIITISKLIEERAACYSYPHDPDDSTRAKARHDFGIDESEAERCSR